MACAIVIVFKLLFKFPGGIGSFNLEMDIEALLITDIGLKKSGGDRNGSRGSLEFHRGTPGSMDGRV